MRAPQLDAAGDPCSGYFPATARAAHGEVELAVKVGALGDVVGTEVLQVRPHESAFARAARACAGRLHFIPATTAAGRHVAGRATLRLRFDRS